METGELSVSSLASSPGVLSVVTAKRDLASTRRKVRTNPQKLSSDVYEPSCLPTYELKKPLSFINCSVSSILL